MRRLMFPPRLPSRKFTTTVLCFIVTLSWVEQASGQRRRPVESVESGESSVILGGWVHVDYGGSIPSDVKVRLATSEGMTGGEQSVNAAGYFEFVGLAKTYYHLTVDAPGFQPYQQDLDLRSVGDKLTINIHLSPALKTKEPSPSASSYTDEHAPKNARKEYQKGLSALQSGKFSEAQSHFEKSVKEYPCYARAQTDLALALSQQHQGSESEAALKKALECDPDFLDAYTDLGQLYYNEGKYADSATIVQEGLRRSPASWQFYYQLGADHYHLGLYTRAEQEYLKAESLSPSVPAEIHVKLADVYLKQSAYDKAYAEMQAYVRAEPDGRFAAKLKMVIHQMESDHLVTAVQPSRKDSPPSKP